MTHVQEVSLGESESLLMISLHDKAVPEALLVPLALCFSSVHLPVVSGYPEQEQGFCLRRGHSCQCPESDHRWGHLEGDVNGGFSGPVLEQMQRFCPSCASPRMVLWAPGDSGCYWPFFITKMWTIDKREKKITQWIQAPACSPSRFNNYRTLFVLTPLFPRAMWFLVSRSKEEERLENAHLLLNYQETTPRVSHSVWESPSYGPSWLQERLGHRVPCWQLLPRQCYSIKRARPDTAFLVCAEPARVM